MSESQKLAKSVYRYIKAHPEQHDQTAWCEPGENECDTTMCIAGTAIYLAEGVEGLEYHRKNGGWSDKARHLLGLSYKEELRLFYELDNEEALRQLLEIASR